MTTRRRNLQRPACLRLPLQFSQVLTILAASGQVRSDSLEQYECLGELALSGEIRFVSAVLPAVIACHRAGRKLIAPQVFPVPGGPNINKP
jgi:hypothetical protein